MKKIKLNGIRQAVIVLIFAAWAAMSLTGCVVRDDHGGDWHHDDHWHDHDHWDHDHDHPY